MAQPVAGASAQLRDPIGVAESEQGAGIGRQTAVRRQSGPSEQFVGTAPHGCDGRAVNGERARAAAAEGGEAFCDVCTHREVPPTASGDISFREHRREERGHPAAGCGCLHQHSGESRVKGKLDHSPSEIGRAAVGESAQVDQQGGRHRERRRRWRVEPPECLGGCPPGGELERQGGEVRPGNLGVGPRPASRGARIRTTAGRRRRVRYDRRDRHVDRLTHERW